MAPPPAPRVFYWFGAHFDTSLLIQALIMILMQLLLLHTALSNRSTPSSKIDHTPFAASHTSRISRPYDFWQWRTSKPYWEFLFYFTLTLLILQFLVGNITTYVSLIGYLALGIEALLPLPQILNNHRSRSCAGFRLSVLASWILGDVMKMVFFFLAESSIPWAFKCCGLFQFVCDLFLGWQYWRYGNGGGGGRVAGEGSWGLEGKDVRLA
ncbi:MAG: hypothetical protein M1835_004375 [Candelina submexicana]|nr:MAG: hypothetical protein M1835_004375 [Candelina submexicana]